MGLINLDSFFRNNEQDSAHLMEWSNLFQLFTEKVITDFEKVLL